MSHTSEFPKTVTSKKSHKRPVRFLMLAVSHEFPRENFLPKKQSMAVLLNQHSGAVAVRWVAVVPISH